ncbi:MAG: hypothetical protein JW894_05250 [Bacteroidales bacterium]|nr:hypothetical protein [Bacteroidales bacterium]
MAKNKKSRYSLLRNRDGVNIDSTSLAIDRTYKVHLVRNLTGSTYILRFDRNEMEFLPGQHITLGLAGENQIREYSIYSSINDHFLEVLIREIEDGHVSRKLKKLNKGDELIVDGPFGFFTLDEKIMNTSKYLFIATGTGIAPFHSIAGAYPGLNYKLIHGVRFTCEAYEKDTYPIDKYVLCTSRDTNNKSFNGRVTDYLKANEVDSDTLVYLCGNCDMIYEVYDLLTTRGLHTDQIKTEVYF